MFPLEVRMHYIASYSTLKNELLSCRSFVPTCTATVSQFTSLQHVIVQLNALQATTGKRHSDVMLVGLRIILFTQDYCLSLLRT